MIYVGNPIILIFDKPLCGEVYKPSLIRVNNFLSEQVPFNLLTCVRPKECYQEIK
jgi:hypothetical protein